jgi:hypothetical protein
MSELEIDRLKKAVEKKYGHAATFAEKIPVSVNGDQPRFEGMVHVFDLAEHPTAARAYAWWTDGQSGRRYHAELHFQSIDSAHAAVEAMTRRRVRRRGRA